MSFWSHFEKAPSRFEKWRRDLEDKLEVIPYSIVDHMNVKNQTWQNFWSSTNIITSAAGLIHSFHMPKPSQHLHIHPSS